MNKKRIFISILLSAAFLGIVFTKVPLRTVAVELQTANLFWFGTAIAVLATTITLSAIRWYLVLRTQQFHLSLAQAIRATWYGHFFNTLLLGPAAGDIFKSTLFSKEQNLPLVQILSTSWLDRILAGFGSILFAFLVVIFTLANGKTIDLSLPKLNPLLICSVAAGCLLLCLLIWKFKLMDRIPIIKKFKDTFLEVILKTCKSPRTAIIIILIGCAGQILLSSILAWTLASLVETPLPWIEMLWVFPVIAMLSSLPISVGGIGVREGSALILLTSYQVSKPDAVAASLLCLFTYLLMAAVGGLLIFIGKPKQK